jgi:uncharacterized protein YggE
MIKILAPIFIASSLFGYSVEFNKKFSKEIIQDEAYSYINIYAKKGTEKNAINALSEINKFIANSSIKIRNMKQNTIPVYIYFNNSNKQKIDGYKSSIRFTISSKNNSMVTTYIEELLKLKKNDVEISYSNLAFRISKMLNEKIKDDMQLDILKWANEYEKKLSKKLNQNCRLENIAIGSNINIRPMNSENSFGNKMVKSMSNADISMPVNSSLTNFSMDANFKYECGIK